jgi:hypothetical protein
MRELDDAIQRGSRSRLTSQCFIFALVLNIVACYICRLGRLVLACRIPFIESCLVRLVSRSAEWSRSNGELNGSGRQQRQVASAPEQLIGPDRE